MSRTEATDDGFGTGEDDCVWVCGCGACSDECAFGNGSGSDTAVWTVWVYGGESSSEVVLLGGSAVWSCPVVVGCRMWFGLLTWIVPLACDCCGGGLAV